MGGWGYGGWEEERVLIKVSSVVMVTTETNINSLLCFRNKHLIVNKFNNAIQIILI